MSSTSVIFFNLQIQLIFALFLSLTLTPSLQTHSNIVSNLILTMKSKHCVQYLCVMYSTYQILCYVIVYIQRIKMYSICYTGCYQYIVVSVLVLVLVLMLVYCTMCLSVEKGIYNNGFESLFLFIHRYALNIYIFCGLSAIILNHL